MKVAVIRLLWKRSPSPDVKRQLVEIHVDDEQMTAVEFGPEVSEMQTEIAAGKLVTFKVVAIDVDGLAAQSTAYTFRVSDLVAPLPPTELRHEIVAIKEVEGI